MAIEIATSAVDKRALKTALDRAVKFVARRTTLPILGFVLLEAAPGSLRISATNLETSLRLTIPTEGQGTFKLTVDAVRFRDAISRAKGLLGLSYEEPFETGEDGIVTGYRALVIDKSGGQIKIKGECFREAGEYPTIPNPEGVLAFSVVSSTFAKEMKRVARAASSDETRPAFTGILFEVGEQVRFVAADSYRLHFSDVAAYSTGHEFRALIPAEGLEALLMVLPKEPVALRVDFSPKGEMVIIRWDDGEFTSRVIDSTFPDYQRMVPSAETAENLVILESSALLQAIEAFGNVKYGSNNIRTFSLDGDQLKIRATSEEQEQTEWVEVVDRLNDQFEATLNAIYVKEAMQGFTGKVAFRWWGAQKPVTLSAPEDTHTVVIMPIHTIR